MAAAANLINPDADVAKTARDQVLAADKEYHASLGILEAIGYPVPDNWKSRLYAHWQSYRSGDRLDTTMTCGVDIAAMRTQHKALTEAAAVLEQRYKRSAITIRPTHGTAKQVAIKSIVPRGKRDAEVFWVSQLVRKLADFATLNPQVITNKDDADGQPDVLVIAEERNIGVQVTEFTCELERARQAQRGKFLEAVLAGIGSRNMSAQPPVVANCLLSYSSSRQAVADTIPKLVDAIEHFIHDVTLDSQRVSVGAATVTLDRVKEGAAYPPQVNGIAVDCTLDILPRTQDMYLHAANLIFGKKRAASAQWLVIWSSEFWRDKHPFGAAVVSHLRELFAQSVFDRVYFIESMDGEGFFQPNLAIAKIK